MSTPEWISHLGDVIPAVIRAYGQNDDRTVQSTEGILGPSDLGWCRMKAVLMTRGVEQSDAVPIGKAQRGTAGHLYLGAALAWGQPGWIVDTPENRTAKITATFPSGIAVSGTPDVIDPVNNGIIDIKTNEGIQQIIWHGIEMQPRYQRHTYYLAAMQAGILDPTARGYVGNYYVDPSDYDNNTFTAEEFDPSLTYEIDEWLMDVRDTVLSGETPDELRDIDAPICEVICPFFTVCRGGVLPARDGTFVFTDPLLVNAMDTYDRGRALAKDGKTAMEQSKRVLHGYNGVGETDDGRWLQVRWTHVNNDTNSNPRIDVRKVRTPA